MADCASYTTITYEAYDEASNTWVLAETQKWYFLESGIGLTVYVYPSDSEDIQLNFTVRVTYSSAYTESVSSTFVLTFIGPCYDNNLSLDSMIDDAEVVINPASINTVSIMNTSVTSSILGCSPIETFEI